MCGFSAALISRRLQKLDATALTIITSSTHTHGFAQAVQVCAVAVDAVIYMRGQAGVSGGAAAPVTGRVVGLNRSDVFIPFSSFVLLASGALVVLLVSFTGLGYFKKRWLDEHS